MTSIINSSRNEKLRQFPIIHLPHPIRLLQFPQLNSSKRMNAINTKDFTYADDDVVGVGAGAVSPSHVTPYLAMLVPANHVPFVTTPTLLM